MEPMLLGVSRINLASCRHYEELLEVVGGHQNARRGDIQEQMEGDVD